MSASAVAAASRRGFRAPHRRNAGAASCLRMIVLLSLFPGAISRAADTPAFLPDSEILIRAETLPIDERRQLVYLYARLNKPQVAEAIGEQILATLPRDRQTLLVLASMYVEQKDAAATLRLARRYLTFYPGDHQGRYFLGAGHYLAREFAEASQVLRELKLEQFVQRKYPYETDLAASAYAAGDWHRAMLSYQELLRHHALGDELRDEVRRALDGLYREHLPRWEASAAETWIKSARVSRYGALHGQHLSDRHWLDTRVAMDDVELDAAPGLNATHVDRMEAVATLTTTYDRRWRSEGWIGVSRAGLLAGARLHFRVAKDRDVALELAYAERSTESLTLEALDGRQHRASVQVSWLIESDLAFAGRFGAREILIDSVRLGRGTGMDVTLDQTLWRQGPRILLGYRGSIATFSPVDPATIDPSLARPIADPAGGSPAQQAVIANLVSRRINRHGLGSTITDHLANAWLYRLTAGMDYDFELASVGWNAGLALTFRPRKSIELTGEVAYTSSAGASNAGSAAVLASFFVRAYY